jgi:hypothetical protein
LSADEGALFYIANGFQIRHLSERQKANYDAAFLDWVLQWFLGTIELTDRLLADRTTRPDHVTATTRPTRRRPSAVDNLGAGTSSMRGFGCARPGPVPRPPSARSKTPV